MLVGEIGKLTSGLASALGARASVNTPQCRGVVFLSVVTMAGIMHPTSRRIKSNSTLRPRYLPPSLFLDLIQTPLVVISPPRSRRRSRLPILERLYRA